MRGRQDALSPSRSGRGRSVQPTRTARDERARLRAALVTSSCRMIADLLIDVAAHRESVPTDDRARVDRAMNDLRERIRRREQQCVEQLLQLHRFSVKDLDASDLPMTDGRWGVDLFSPAALRQFGVRTGSAAAAGLVRPRRSLSPVGAVAPRPKSVSPADP